ncbi:MAG: hypothetical protein Q9205_005447 [Flavoplaca limonia]
MAIYSQCTVVALVAGFLLGISQVHGSPLTEYIVWPKEGITVQDVDNVENHLKSLLVNGTGLYTSESASRSMPNFWLVVLNHDSYENLAKHPKIAEISPNEHYCQDQDVSPPKVKSIATNTTAPTPQAQTLGSLDFGRKIFHQNPALNDLRMISQAPNTPLAANPGYTYSIDENEETFIYIPDFGINRAHWEFSTPSRRIEWLYTPQTILHHHDTPTELQWPYPSFRGAHSTCIASKAVGREVGSARHATLVVVKMFPTRAGLAEMMPTIIKDIVSKRRTHHSVVSCSFSCQRERSVDRRMTADIVELIRRGVPVVVVSGNAAPLVAGVVAEQLTEMNRQGLFYPPLRNEYIYEKLQWTRPNGLPILWNRMDGTRSALETPSNSSGTANA